MAIHKSGEDYLEAILMIRAEKGTCRSVDVARRLGVSKPSVSVAMGALREEGMILTDKDGELTFTETGLAVAEEIYDRHIMVSEFLVSIGVPEEIAREDACRIEHDMSPETCHCLRRFLTERRQTEQ